jgi:hypothetical protein
MAEALQHPACVALPDAMATVKFSAQGAGAGCGLVLQMEFDGLPLDLRASFERIVKAVPAFGLEQAHEP